jgi:hypothetical protein
VSVTAPITNSGTSTSAQLALATGNGLTTSGGNLVADFGTTSTTVASGDRGLPTGGTTGQVLVKNSGTDYAVGWDTRSQPASNPMGFTPAVSGRLFLPEHGPTQLGSGGDSQATKVRFWVYNVRPARTVASIRNYCWTAQAGSTLRVGLYNVDGDGRPTTLIADYGTLSGATIGIKSVTGSTVVSGPIALAVAASDHATVRWGRALVTASTVYKPYGDSSPANDRPGCYWFASADYSAGLPADAPSVSVGDNVTGQPAIVAYLEFT